MTLKRPRITIGRIVGGILLCLIVWRFFNPIRIPESFDFTSGKQFRIQKVVDGDTFELTDGRRVRLIGIDTPEYKNGKPQPFAEEATQFANRFLASKSVELRFDRQRLDRYHRILAYAYVGDRFLNEELILAGLATAELQYDYRSDIKRQFTKAEEVAKTESRGIWSLPKADKD